MKKNEKKLKNFTASLSAKENVLKRLRMRSNTLSDEARDEAEAVIEEKEAEIESLRSQIEELDAAEENMDEQLRALVAELQGKVEEVEASLRAPKNFVQVQNFLKSEKAERLFLDTVRRTQDVKEFAPNWRAALIQNGLFDFAVDEDGNSSPEAFTGTLPEAVLEEINDAWESAADGFLQLLDVTGLLALKTLTDVNDADSSRAHAHQKGSKKDEQALIFKPKEIRAEIIYKFIRIDRETVEYENAGGALLRYITRELATRIVHEIMRCVLVGDGRYLSDNPGSAEHPLLPKEGHVTKLEPITQADPLYTRETLSRVPVIIAHETGANPTDADEHPWKEGCFTYPEDCIRAALTCLPTIDEVAAMVSTIEAEGDIHLFCSKALANHLRRFVYAGGGTPVYNALEDLAQMLGVAGIHTTRILPQVATSDGVCFNASFDCFSSGSSAEAYLKDKYGIDCKGTENPDYNYLNGIINAHEYKMVQAIAFVPSAYKVVGDVTVRGFENFNLAYNKNEYLNEVYIGGALTVPFSGAYLTQLLQSELGLQFIQYKLKEDTEEE
ncbi:MAG: hypothetical protein LUE20_00405 [Oscillospiraceae bacterium]|nr:hypothetical protein [Oscillospiraceae bacterium]